jgi:hypothetical protein
VTFTATWRPRGFLPTCLEYLETLEPHCEEGCLGPQLDTISCHQRPCLAGRLLSPADGRDMIDARSLPSVGVVSSPFMPFRFLIRW